MEDVADVVDEGRVEVEERRAVAKELVRRPATDPGAVLEAAADLGCSKAEAFLRVTLPLSLPGVVAGFLFVFIPTVGEYVTPALVGGTEGIMYGNIVFDQFLRALNWPLGALMSLAMLVVVLIPLVVVGRFIRLSDLAGV